MITPNVVGEDPLWSRRRLLVSSGAAIGGALLEMAFPIARARATESWRSGARFLGLVPFVAEGSVPLEQLVDEGLDGRLYTRLDSLRGAPPVVDNARFYVRTRAPREVVRELAMPRAREGWRIDVGGLVPRPFALRAGDLARSATSKPDTLLECAGNTRHVRFAMMSAARWRGVALADVLDEAHVSPNATSVLVEGVDHRAPTRASRPGASWVLRLDEVRETGAFLATEMNGEPLPLEHGSPVRLIVPGWYGCASVKWAHRIALVDETERATDHMREFASRTHQHGVPSLARDFAPPRIDRAAMPVRVERWAVGDRVQWRIVGIAWGGDRRAAEAPLLVRIGAESGARWERVDRQLAGDEAAGSGRTWDLWTHTCAPRHGRTPIALRVGDVRVPTRRMSAGHYARIVEA